MSGRDPEAGKNTGLPNGQCSRGWGKRCPASKGPHCRCACGGANHGKANGRYQLAGLNGEPARARALYTWGTQSGVTLIEDASADLPVISVTNDAEAVVAEVWRLGGRGRFIYRDTEGNWDELLHDEGVFRGFAPTGASDRKSLDAVLAKAGGTP